ncbi:MAG: hypothetical protein H6662_14035 [Ardenticatenaceae bacterium]|nr:hypothetical protein [Anaerolineales bacterium]MCB8922702.1 hypothetical protein [Ardenticatenaceae bacterium]MCB8991749.1 hypothetical protein [Ardenticatenaceae bacterium]MCB9003590.1 hypothetical protein [Ardenticatenaceae bacterium]
MTTDDRKEVLDLLANGKLTVDEAAAMLAKAKEPAAPPPPAEPVPVVEIEKEATAVSPDIAPGKTPAWFRVRVNKLDTGKSKVSVNIPIRMLKFGFTVASHFAPDMDGLDVEELQGMLAEGESGILVDVRDEESNEHVQVYLE